MLDLDDKREAVAPRDAATLVLVRDAPEGGIEVFCVERHKTGFLGGAVVFPGGKVDASDADAAWLARTTAPRAPKVPSGDDDRMLRALGVAACREALEEAAILPVRGGELTHDDLLAMRARLAAREAPLFELLRERGLMLDLGALWPFARWVTPEAESRRFDARFFVAIAPDAQPGAHDEHETTASFWATPGAVLARFDAGELQLAPPTHRTLEVLATCARATDALALAERSSLEPICPRLIRQRDADGSETMALTLPGDPEHPVSEARVAGRSRFVLRGDRFRPEDPPGCA